MDMIVNLIHNILNLVALPVSFFTLCFLLPPFYFFKTLLSVLTSVISEDVAGKVVLITGASSGIGEHLAYEYARRGACLALVARRQNQLQEVAVNAINMGAADVITINGDVSKVGDCKRFVDDTINHYGRLDHLVNNAGIAMACMFDESNDATEFRNIMATNFWGSVYTTRFALPYLRDTGGKIAVLSSAAAWLSAPRMSIYNASKAAVMSMFETLRVEVGSDIKITVVTPGYIESELTQGKFVVKGGKMVVDQDLRDVQVGAMPVGSVEGCAKAIVNGVCRGDRYVTYPAWFRITYHWKVLCPEALDWMLRMLFVPNRGSSFEESLSKKILDITGAKKMLYPSTIKMSELKTD